MEYFRTTTGIGYVVTTVLLPPPPQTLSSHGPNYYRIVHPELRLSHE